jgi:uncharacterized membrane protein (UPF0127 family)
VSKLAGKLVDRSTGRVVIQSLELATTFWQRFRGWQLYPLPPAGHGLMLAPCSSVHTFAMRFPIDIIFLAQDGQVLSVRSHVMPWRIVAPVQDATAVVELPSGRCLVKKDQRLVIALDEAAMPIKAIRAMTVTITHGSA